MFMFGFEKVSSEKKREKRKSFKGYNTKQLFSNKHRHRINENAITFALFIHSFVQFIQ